MKALIIIAGLIGGFFVERAVMRLTETAVAKTLGARGESKRLFAYMTIKNLFILIILILAAIWSAAFLLSLSAGMVLYIFFYVIKRNRHIGKTIEEKGSDGTWKE